MRLSFASEPRFRFQILLQPSALLFKAMRNYIFFFFACFLLNASSTNAQSGCQVCASTGQCAAAYNSGPGQFCGYFQPIFSHTKPCCCPQNSICKLTSSDCLCHVPSRYDNYGNYGNYGGGGGTGGGFIALVVMIIIICCCCRMCASTHSYSTLGEEGSTFIPVAVPATGVPYGSFNPPATAPGYYADGRTRNSGGGGGLGSALGGFALGEIIGNAIGRNEARNRGFGGWGGGGGGWGGGGSDIRGDTGGGGGFGGGGRDIRGSS